VPLNLEIIIFPKVDRAAYKPASVGERKCFARITSMVNREVKAKAKAIVTMIMITMIMKRI